ncbi:MAG TPA: cation:proton antiporter [Candidatus Dormibacteraeota bacterium]
MIPTPGVIQSTELLSSIGICVTAAALLALVGYRLRQPLILAYLVTGVVIGPHVLQLVGNRQAISTVSEIGLILLLFVIGLEIDLKRLLGAGRAVAAVGFLQVPVCIALGLAFFGLLPGLGGGRYTVLYLAACMSMSSTMIVVKLLYDKHDLDTLPGRITLGALVFQDVWAVAMLAVQPNLSNPDLRPLAISLLEGIGLVVWALAMSRYVLPRVFRAVAKAPELVLVTALAWCFFLAAAASLAGLSREMGALIAGVSISTFPYSADVGTKVGSIRDFFVTLFFVALGMQIPVPSPNLLLLAAVAAAFLVLSRAVVVPILYASGLGQRASILPAINLANISEFSIVIASLGFSRGHVDSSVVTIVILTFAVTSISSTYMIAGSDRVYRLLHRVLQLLRIPDLDRENQEIELAHAAADVVFLGFFRDASSVLHEFEHYGRRRIRHRLLRRMVVIDFNPHVVGELRRRGVPCIYGDISDVETLARAHLDNVRLVVSSITDAVLRGTHNRALLAHAKQVWPQAAVILATDHVPEALEFYEAGADYVFIPRMHSAQDLAGIITAGLSHGFAEIRQGAMAELHLRDEVLA